MRIPWKIRFIMGQLNWSTLRKVSQILRKPSRYYGSLVDLALRKNVQRPWRFVFRDGNQMKVSHFMSSYIFREIFIDKCYDEALEALSIGAPRILEIGGNTGFFTLRAKALIPNARITSYEPEPSNYMAFLDLINENNLLDVVVHCEAMGAKDGIITLHLNDKNIGGHSTVKSFDSGRAEAVPMISLDRLLEDHPYFDLVKLDCEGAEYDILKSIQAEHAAKLPKLVFETDGSEARKKALFDHLESLGYQIRASSSLYIAEL